jgi:hypothetical protein
MVIFKEILTVKKYIILSISILLFLMLTGCNNEVEVGYSPPLPVPIRVSVDTSGNISVDASGKWITPIGTFDIQGTTDLYSIQNEYDVTVLIVRLDNEAMVYKLQPGGNFHIVFDDSNKLYRKVAFKQQPNGDFILEIESVQITATKIPPSSVALSVATESGYFDSASPSDVEEEDTSEKEYVYISCDEDITQAALRKSPGYIEKDDDVDIIYKIDCGERLELLGDSQIADGLTWWRVSWHGYVGWMADHTGSGRTILIFR